MQTSVTDADIRYWGRRQVLGQTSGTEIGVLVRQTMGSEVGIG